MACVAVLVVEEPLRALEARHGPPNLPGVFLVAHDPRLGGELDEALRKVCLTFRGFAKSCSNCSRVSYGKTNS